MQKGAKKPVKESMILPNRDGTATVQGYDLENDPQEIILSAEDIATITKLGDGETHITSGKDWYNDKPVTATRNGSVVNFRSTNFKCSLSASRFTGSLARGEHASGAIKFNEETHNIEVGQVFDKKRSSKLSSDRLKVESVDGDSASVLTYNFRDAKWSTTQRNIKISHLLNNYESKIVE